MKTIELSIGWILVVASIFVHACGESPKEKAAREEKARAEARAQSEAKRNEIINALKAAYKADDTWQQGLGLSTWTVDLQEQILGKPIVSSGKLVDVSLGQDGKYYLHLINTDYGPRLDFFLVCSNPKRPTQVSALAK
jgi:hypothetical protein